MSAAEFVRVLREHVPAPIAELPSIRTSLGNSIVSENIRSRLEEILTLPAGSHSCGGYYDQLSETLGLPWDVVRLIGGEARLIDLLERDGHVFAVLAWASKDSICEDAMTHTLAYTELTPERAAALIERASTYPNKHLPR